ncbi:MAG TPA: hypothetical protein VI756_28150 [Blastocatellia bacterium]
MADAEFEKGIHQARLAHKWARERTADLAAYLGRRASDIAQLRIEPLVLSKSGLPTWWPEIVGVPIANERLLDWVLGNPHHRSLEIFWQVAKERRFLPKLGKHFVDLPGTIEFGGVRFTGESIGFKLEAPFDPLKDIDVTGLA